MRHCYRVTYFGLTRKAGENKFLALIYQPAAAVVSERKAQQLDLSHDPLHKPALEEMGCNVVIDIGLLDSPKLSCTVEPTSYGYALTGGDQL